jgi:hypothetical protein
MTSGRDSTTSRAVNTPPAADTAAARSAVAPNEVGTSVRKVMEYPGLGLAMLVSSPQSAELARLPMSKAAAGQPTELGDPRSPDVIGRHS